MYEDFYRRQYYEEIRLNIRKFTDTDPEFKMPPFSIFRPHGGALPVPNGYKIDTSYSYDLYRVNKEASESDLDEVTLNEDGSYTINNYQSSRRPGAAIHETQTSDYESNPDEFEDMLSRTDDDTMWEELERIAPGEM